MIFAEAFVKKVRSATSPTSFVIAFPLNGYPLGFNSTLLEDDAILACYNTLIKRLLRTPFFIKLFMI